MYILFEGVDTCGKTTQIELLKEKLDNIVTTKEPGGTSTGSKIRSLVLDGKIHSKQAEILLFLADRAEHFKQVIKPNQDKLIISDRGLISGLAYALSNDKNVDLDFLVKLNLFSLENTLPNFVFLFQTNEKLLKQRLSKKSHDTIEQRGIKYLLDVQNNMEIVTKKLGIDYQAIDASKSIKDIHTQISSRLQALSS
jgi:dTMP kinase